MVRQKVTRRGRNWVAGAKKDCMAGLLPLPLQPPSFWKQQTVPRSFEPLVIKILCAAAQLALASSGDFNGTKKH